MRISDWSSDVCSSDLGAIPVEAGGQSSGPRQSGDPRIGFRRIVDQLAYRKPVARGEQSLGEAANQEDVDVPRTPFLLEAAPVFGGMADRHHDEALDSRGMVDRQFPADRKSVV